MLNAIAAISALLLAAGILVTGNGLQGTLLAVRADLEQFPTALIGVLMAAYYAGFILGCRINPRFIKSVGHIRTFVALASIASASTLLHPLFIDVVVWAFLRGVTGFCFAGLIMIIESWLNERATNATRGRLLSVYRVIDLGGAVAGNAMLAIASPAGFELFALTSILISLALVPVALTRSAAPRPIATARLDLPKLMRLSPAAAIGAPMVGLANAAFWAVGPVYAQKIGYDKSVIAAFMSCVIVGGALLQWPLGYLSDRIDRRIVMTGSAVIGAFFALALARFGAQSETALLALGAGFGAFVLPMFGLTAAHANDHAEPNSAVETSGGVLLINAIGSVVGAVMGGAVMSGFGPNAVFIYIGGVYFTIAIVLLVRIVVRAPTPEAEKEPFVPVPRTAAPTVFEISEETDESAERPAPPAPPEK